MDKNIKLIWDFRGPDAQKTAEHHQAHLQEFATREKIVSIDSGCEKISALHWAAFIVVKENDMISVRDALIPHRGEIVR